MSEDKQSGSSPEEAFAAIGNEVRAEILRVLGGNPHTEIPFSELHSRVDPDLDTGQFNYHLKKLLGRFVEKGDEGYTLRSEGLNLYRTIRAGSFNRSPSIEPFEVGFDCYFCGMPVEAEYEDGSFEMQCPGCDHVYIHRTMPPSAVDSEDTESLLSRVDQYNRHKILANSRGVCPICVNSLGSQYLPGEEVWAEGSEQLDVFINSSCDHCGLNHYMSVGLMLLYHPSLISFFHDRGCDIITVPHWEFEFAMTDRNLEVRSRDPWEVALTVTCDDDSLQFVLDDDMNVVEENYL